MTTATSVSATAELTSSQQAALNQLVELIRLTPCNAQHDPAPDGTQTQALDHFTGQSQDIGSPAVFGGQVLGQALMAASRTVEAGRAAHSLHAYFMLPGAHEAIDYAVERLRDGGSFSTRRVVALQKDRPIFELLASFKKPEEGFDRHDPMPAVPGPEGIRSEREYRQKMAERLPPSMREKWTQPRGIDYRPVVPFDWFDAQPREARASVWMKANGQLPDDPALHQALLAYASDHYLLLTATLPHGLSLMQGQVKLASIDHAMWFHRPFRLDDWLLYHMDAPTVCGSRALCRGSIYTRDGVLVATTMQEGLMRARGG